MSEKLKICFIVNPISGIGKQKVINTLIETYLNKSKFEYTIAHTNAPKHAIQLAKEYAQKEYAIVVAVGGDGSVNEIAKGLVNTTTAMAIIPAGSGNGLARHLNIPIDLKKAIEVINSAKSITIDTIQFNQEQFVNVAGIGFDAHIGWQFANYGKRGFSSYLKIIMREFPKYKARNYELMVDGKKIYKEAFLISFANGSQWGNNAHIAPTADIADGIMDIAILKNFKFMSVLSIGYRLFKKTLDQSSHLEIIKAKSITIHQPSTIAHIDGEAIEVGNTIEIKVNPLSLKVIVP